MKIRKKKGFTLIELLIVVAIIAILAAIAIPQFAAYRVKGYNAAASSDIRNGKTAEEALFADFQGYGTTSNTNMTVRTTTGDIVTASPAYFSFADIDAASTVRQVTASISNGVGIGAHTNTPTAGVTRPANYTVFTKHTQGDRIFGGDSDDTIIRWKVGTAGTALASSDTVASTAGGDITTVGWNAL